MRGYDEGLFDRDGKPISMERCSELRADRSYKRVALDKVGVYEVSTVWLGFDHGWSEGPPIIFETMVFAPDEETLGPDLGCRRYCTEAEALAGHAEQILLIRATAQEDVPAERVREDNQ